MNKETWRGFSSVIVGALLWEVSTRLALVNELLIPPFSSLVASL
jgi:hypothetical protein